MNATDRGRVVRTFWLGGKWFDHVGGDDYLTQLGTWNCFNCGAEAPFSFWRALTGAAR